MQNVEGSQPAKKIASALILITRAHPLPCSEALIQVGFGQTLATPRIVSVFPVSYLF